MPVTKLVAVPPDDDCRDFARHACGGRAIVASTRRGSTVLRLSICRPCRSANLFTIPIRGEKAVQDVADYIFGASGAAALLDHNANYALLGLVKQGRTGRREVSQ